MFKCSIVQKAFWLFCVHCSATKTSHSSHYKKGYNILKSMSTMVNWLLFSIQQNECSHKLRVIVLINHPSASALFADYCCYWSLFQFHTVMEFHGTSWSSLKQITPSNHIQYVKRKENYFERFTAFTLNETTVWKPLPNTFWASMDWFAQRVATNSCSLQPQIFEQSAATNRFC